MHNIEYNLESKVNKFISDFVRKTDHLISARQPDFIIIKNKKDKPCRIVDFAVLANHRIQSKESGKRDKCQDIANKFY